MGHVSLLEMALFGAAGAASLGLFYLRLRRILRTILGSRPEAGFRLAPLGPRAAGFVREVLCQAKVIRHRPLPGLAHALVFWGFCVFALVTANHVAQGFGAVLLETRQGPFGRYYAALAMVFALAVAASITGLAIRRFVVRPPWLGEKVSAESGVIAFLIFALMATYLAEYFWRPGPGSPGGKAIWWAHSLALLVFLPLLPRTKHLHLALAPITVFLGRGGFARIPPLAGDEDFGLCSGQDVTRLVALQAYSCVECGRCQEQCPAHATGKALNPKSIALGLRAYLNEHGPGGQAPLLGKHVGEEAVFQCTTCGACEYQCPVGIEHLPLIIGLRRGAVNTGQWADGYGAQLFVKLERYGNPLGMAAIERDRFIEKHGLPYFDGTQEFCLWLGCMGSYEPKGRAAVLALAEVLRAAGVSFGVLRKEKCTGDAARRLGNDLAFQQLAEFNIAQMEAAGVARIVSMCPHCVRTIGEDWKEFGARYEVVHHSEWLARQVGLPAGDGAGSIVYHDPCYLGRYRGAYEQPRRVIRASGRLVEPGRTRERSFCCGAGGGQVFLGEEKGARISHQRARELLASGAGQIAVACPFCRTMIEDGVRALAGEGAPRLVDIAELAAARLPARGA